MIELGRIQTARAKRARVHVAFARQMLELLLLINTGSPFNRQTVMQMSPDPLG